MRSTIAITCVGLLLLSSTPADAGLGGLISSGARAAARGAGRGAGTAARGAGTAARGAGRAATHIPSTPAAVPRVVVPRGAPRAVTRLDPEAQRATAMVILTRSHADDPVAVALRSTESPPSGLTRSAADVEEAAVKQRRETLADLIDSSADAAGSILDSDDAARGDVDAAEQPAMVDAEWQRHAKRMKRIGSLAAHLPDEEGRALVARVREKEERRHQRMLELLEGRLYAGGER